MSKVEELAKKYCEGSSFEDACMEKPAYIAGYHQAEKDLHKSIYKAGFLDGFEDAIEEQYEKGYEQAEKDLKSALVAEIEKCYNECLKRAKITDSDYWNAKADTYRNVLAILNDILEVKAIKEESYVTKKVGSYTTTTKIIKKGEKA